MPKLNDFQNSTITLLDYLYFHDIMAMETFSDEKLNIYGKLEGLLESISHKRITGDLRIEYYKHLLIVGLDFELTFRVDKYIFKGSEYEQMEKNYRIYLTQQIEQLGFNLDEYEQDLEELLAKTPLESISDAAAFKIVSQMLYFEYDNITIGVFSKFLDDGFFTVAKYKKPYQTIDEQFINKLFLRAMLFLEFEIIKNTLIKNIGCEKQFVDLNNLEDYQKIIECIETRGKAQLLQGIRYDGIHTVKTKNDLKKFLINVGERLAHNPIFSSGLANWISLIGAWHVKIEKNTNIERPLIIENHYKGDSSCTALACRKLKKYGFVISEKTLFDSYDRVYKIYELIRMTVDELVKNKMYGPREKVLTQDFFYNPNSSPLFKEELKKAIAKFDCS